MLLPSNRSLKVVSSTLTLVIVFLSLPICGVTRAVEHYKSEIIIVEASEP